jgi:predicted nucleic acid-binding protein
MVETQRVDIERAGVLVQDYADLRLGLVDATLVAVAERLGVRTVATFDWRHLGVVRPRHGRLTLVP